MKQLEIINSVDLDHVVGGEQPLVDPNLSASTPSSAIVRICGDNGCPALRKYVEQLRGPSAYKNDLEKARAEVAGKEFIVPPRNQ